MKKNALTKVLATALASTMILGMAACGSSETKTDAPAASNAPAAAESKAPAAESKDAAAEAPKETQTISWSVIDLNAGNNNVGDHAEEIMKQIQEYCGVNIDIQWVANDALA